MANMANDSDFILPLGDFQNKDTSSDEVVEVISELLVIQLPSLTTTKSQAKASWVWNYFLFDDNVKKARCNLCKTLITTSKGSTTGMLNHMKTKHKITKDSNEQNQRQLTLQESLQDFSKIIVSSIFYFNL